MCLSSISLSLALFLSLSELTMTAMLCSRCHSQDERASATPKLCGLYLPATTVRVNVACACFQIMPGSRGDSTKKEGGLKPLSASDERKIDAAIELANEFAIIQSSDCMSASADSIGEGPTPGSAVELGGEHAEGSWSQKTSMFSVRRSKSPSKQPPPEKKTFTEEIASLPTDMNEEVTPEAQEAYNMLVVKGSVKDKGDSFRAIRERRMQRSLQHQSSAPPQPAERPLPATTTTATTAASSGLRNGHRSVNMNLRKPQGIPVRGGAGGLRGRDTRDTHEDEQDVNPLRRLRDSQSLVVKPRSGSSRSSTDTDLVNGSSQSSRPAKDNLHRPNLNPNLSFFAKLKEQEMENGGEDDVADEGGKPSPVVPPRVPLRNSTVNSKPRERKHPLNMSNYDASSNRLSGHSGSESPPPPPPASSRVSHGNVPSNVDTCSSPAGSRSSHLQHPSFHGQPCSQDTDDCVFVDAAVGSRSPRPPPPPPPHRGGSDFSQPRPYSISSCDSQLSVNVKSVTASAHDLGIDNGTDMFWAQQVNFGEFACEFDPELSDDDDGDEHAPIPGRYKTSDTVSYEDLMEFALDGPYPRYLPALGFIGFLFLFF